jgi:prepilin-type processing-associated H-X9-DG protein
MSHTAELALVYDGFFHHDSRANLMGHARHNNGTMTNFLFADGHAAGVRTNDLPKSFDPADLAAVPFPKYLRRQD